MCSFVVLFHLCVALVFIFYSFFYPPTRMNTHSIPAKVENDFCTISIYWNDETSDHIRFRCWQKKGLNEMKQKCFVQLAHFRSSSCHHGTKRFRVIICSARSVNKSENYWLSTTTFATLPFYFYRLRVYCQFFEHDTSQDPFVSSVFVFCFALKLNSYIRLPLQPISMKHFKLKYNFTMNFKR